jgi:hypothetical protein
MDVRSISNYNDSFNRKDIIHQNSSVKEIDFKVVIDAIQGFEATAKELDDEVKVYSLMIQENVIHDIRTDIIFSDCR